jgi:Domain of unknown function (DUF1905)/Bacteriocin-protection, YdeI or OmpD-Associated
VTFLRWHKYLSMIQFSTTILQFDKKGEKTGWSYIEITAAQAQKLKPGYRVSFRIMGKLDNYSFEKTALLPMGDGNFILPINGKIRKAIGKRRGDSISVTMEADKRPLSLSKDFMKCLKDDEVARLHFNSLPKSHQHYFSNWIESAKTPQTKTKRIVMAVTALGMKQGFGEMMRATKSNPY